MARNAHISGGAHHSSDFLDGGGITTGGAQDERRIGSESAEYDGVRGPDADALNWHVVGWLPLSHSAARHTSFVASLSQFPNHVYEARRYSLYE